MMDQTQATSAVASTDKDNSLREPFLPSSPEQTTPLDHRGGRKSRSRTGFHSSSRSGVTTTMTEDHHNEDEDEWAVHNKQNSSPTTSLHQTCLYRMLGFPKPIGCYNENEDSCADHENNDEEDDQQQQLHQTRFVLSSPLLHMAMLSNLSTSYNVINVGYVLDLMAQSSEQYKKDRTSESDGLCASTLLLGMVFGQLLGGILGDQISRQRALFVVMCIQILGSLGSAFLLVHPSSEEDEFTVYDSLAAWRFVLGLGCGGVYPLAATMTSELVSSSSSSNQPSSSNEDDNAVVDDILAERIKSKLVAVTFSTQGIGFLLVPLVTWSVVLLFGADGTSSAAAQGSAWAWRLILAVGCLPGIVVLLMQMCISRRSKKKATAKNRYHPVHNEQRHDINHVDDDVERAGSVSKNHDTSKLHSQPASTIGQQQQPLSQPSAVDVGWMATADSDDSSSAVDSSRRDNGDGVDDSYMASSPSIVQAIRTEPNIVQKLGGTAICWFLFDVLFYGNTLFTPVVLREAFGTSETVSSTARDALVLSLLALPGYFLSVLTLGRLLTPRWVQLQGFAMMGVLFLVIGVYFKTIEKYKIGLLILYGMTFMFANWGPNTTTFMMPSLTFSKHCRSTLNGVAAASGKMGALLGSTMFEPLAKDYGDAVVMILCAGVSAIGFLLTFLCLEKQKKLSSLRSTTHPLTTLSNNGNADIFHPQQPSLNHEDEQTNRVGPLNLSNSEIL